MAKSAPGEASQEFRRELAILLRLRHPHLVLFMGATAGDPTCIISECFQRERPDRPRTGERD